MRRLMHFAVLFIASFLLFGMLYYLLSRARASAIASSAIPLGTIQVNTLEDSVDGDSDCSLREAITAANTNAPSGGCPAGSAGATDTITFDVQGIITLTSQLSVTAGGPLVIDGGDVITTSGGSTTLVWWIETGSDITFTQMAIVNSLGANGGGLYNNAGRVNIIESRFSNNEAGLGSGIYNKGLLNIIDTSFTNNYAENPGGGIFNQGSITVTNSIFSGNTSSYMGGGIYSEGIANIVDSIFSGNQSASGAGLASGGTTTVNHSTFTGNEGGLGGGIYHGSGTLDIIKSTFFGNTADRGGAVDSKAILTIESSTFWGNSAKINGGGLLVWWETTINNSTISGNHADEYGGGIITAYSSNLLLADSTISDNEASYGGGLYNYGYAHLSSTIIANNAAGSDCQSGLGAITDFGHNLDSDDSCDLDQAKGSLPNTDPMLGALQDNGGPTLTEALQTSSPAIDAGDNAACPDSDQRGVTRPVDGNGDGIAVCDIGAYEVQLILSHRIYLPITAKQH